jgi:hypothetical protein
LAVKFCKYSRRNRRRSDRKLLLHKALVVWIDKMLAELSFGIPIAARRLCW